ncbi:MAG: S41 family peptidase [Syntrophomonadaceae bacterium]|nr:S41 family peptidase [Syntrophomonadaceae bacterium]
MFFSAIGVVTVICTIALLATSGPGLATLFSVIGLIKTESLYQIDTARMLEGAGAGIVEALDDPYSRYLDKQTYQDLKVKLEAKFGGIGVYVGQDNQGRIMIYSPIKGTPAYKEGIRHGDIIVRINGQSTMKMTSDEAVQLMRGDPGTKLELGVYRDSEGKELNFTIVREIINVPSVEDQILDEAAGIGYISLNQFHAQSANEVATSVEKLINGDKVKGIILDLRYNGGGDFNTALDIAGIFLDGDTVVMAADNKGNQQVYKASSGKVDIPLVVLVNQDSASAAEILAAALQDNRRAELVGVKTFGKGLVQTVFPLHDGGALKLTTQKYYTPNGRDINEVGITPDYEVQNDPDSSEDLQLTKAINVLKEKLQKQS